MYRKTCGCGGVLWDGGGGGVMVLVVMCLEWTW